MKTSIKNELTGRVIIRIVPDKEYQGGEFILFFPDEKESYSDGLVNSYMTVGAHGSASYEFYRETLPIPEARKTEAALFIVNYIRMVQTYCEGYNPRIVTRWVGYGSNYTEEYLKLLGETRF